MSEQPDQLLAVATETATVPSRPPMYFPVSITKLVLMSLCTFGVYEIYWYYRQWGVVKRRERSDIMPFGRAIFAYFFCYSLFKKIEATAESQQVASSVEPAALTAGWIIFTLLARLPDPFWLATFLAVAFLWPVQKTVNEINKVVSPNHDPNSRFTGWNIAGIVVGAILWVVIIVGLFLPETQ